jgi:putative transposase
VAPELRKTCWPSWLCPRGHWPQLASTITLERVMKEIKGRDNVVGNFPNEAVIIRLVGTLPMEQTDEGG